MRDRLARLSAPASALALVSLADPSFALALPVLVVAVFTTRARTISRVFELTIYLAIAGALVATARFGGEPKGGVPTEIALVAATVLLARAFFVTNLAPRGGELALVLVAAIATGGPPQRFLPYGPVALLALVSTALGRDPGAVAGTRARAYAALALMLTLSVGVGIGTSKALPRLSYRIAGRLVGLFVHKSRTGFSDSMALGEANEILESDRLELRVTGDTPDYLRGRVYDLFDGKTWIAMNAQVLGPNTLETEVVGHVEAERPSAVYYSPLDTGVANSPRRADGTSRGALRGSWDFAKTKAASKALPPSRNDTQVPSSVGPDVQALALEWTAGANTTGEKLRALEGHLRRDFHYSLKRERVAGPALQDFLFVHREGHCEFFASALAVLARTLGIPARTVGGFRVIERGPLGKVWLVREKHAHAWVEAYADGEWSTWDPTPPGAMLASTPPTWERIFEGFREGLTKLAEPQVYVPSGLAIAGIVTVVVLVRRARARRAKKVAPLHPELVRLETALSRDGLVRSPSEGLYAFAQRLEGAHDVEAAEAIRSFAAWAYGGEGNLDPIRDLVARRASKRSRRATTNDAT